jgi:hypothetical protein
LKYYELLKKKLLMLKLRQKNKMLNEENRLRLHKLKTLKYLL